jgi:hypothetical protein
LWGPSQGIWLLGNYCRFVLTELWFPLNEWHPEGGGDLVNLEHTVFCSGSPSHVKTFKKYVQKSTSNNSGTSILSEFINTYKNMTIFNTTNTFVKIHVLSNFWTAESLQIHGKWWLLQSKPCPSTWWQAIQLRTDNS